AVQRRTGFVHPRSLLGAAEGLEQGMAAADVTQRQLTKAEMRLFLAAYLGSRVDKQDDQQLFLPEGKQRRRRKGTVISQRTQEQFPPQVLAPKSVPLTRLLAIYHRLARKPQLLSPQLFQHFAGLREAGLIRFLGGEKSFKLDREPKVMCRGGLPLARAFAKELKIDLAEYLCK
ncbi:unnamed protein product, partial [Polarella glacialis]